MKWKYVFVVVVDDGFGLAEAGVDDYTRCRRFFQLFKNVSAGFLLSLAGARPNPPACGRHHLLFLVSSTSFLPILTIRSAPVTDVPSVCR